MYDQIVSKKESKICSSGQQGNMYFEKMVDATCKEKGVKFLKKKRERCKLRWVLAVGTLVELCEI